MKTCENLFNIKHSWSTRKPFIKCNPHYFIYFLSSKLISGHCSTSYSSLSADFMVTLSLIETVWQNRRRRLYEQSWRITPLRLENNSIYAHIVLILLETKIHFVINFPGYFITVEQAVIIIVLLNT